MSRPNTGDYIITMYDGYGAKLRDLTAIASNVTAAVAVGEAKVVDDGDIATAKSFTVDRRIYNSLDKKGKF